MTKRKSVKRFVEPESICGFVSLDLVGRLDGFSRRKHLRKDAVGNSGEAFYTIPARIIREKDYQRLLKAARLS